MRELRKEGQQEGEKEGEREGEKERRIEGRTDKEGEKDREKEGQQEGEKEGERERSGSKLGDYPVKEDLLEKIPYRRLSCQGGSPATSLPLPLHCAPSFSLSGLLLHARLPTCAGDPP